MSELTLFTRESLNRTMPDLIGIDSLIPGSLAVTGFALGNFKGEIFDSWRDGSGFLDYDVEVIIHGDGSYPEETVGLSHEEAEEVHLVESGQDSALQAIALLGLHRSFRFRRNLYHPIKS